MRYLFTAFVMLYAGVGSADAPQFDQTLALDAGRAYMESYLRLHGLDGQLRLDWSKVSVEFVPHKHGSFSGYVGVFVPVATGGGGAHAYFDVLEGHPGHLFVIEWGAGASALQEDYVRHFREDAASGRLPGAVH